MIKNFDNIAFIASQFKKAHIELSLFIDPAPSIVEASCELKAQWIELHTGSCTDIYAMLYSKMYLKHHSIKALEMDRRLHDALKEALLELSSAAYFGHSLGLKVAAGHGLNYHNVHGSLRINELLSLILDKVLYCVQLLLVCLKCNQRNGGCTQMKIAISIGDLNGID